MLCSYLLMLLWCCSPSFCNGSCELPKQLTNETLQSISDGCVEVTGNLQIHASIDNDLLINKFRHNNWLCNESVNVIEIKYNYYLKHLKWDSLETIVGPGIIDLEDAGFLLCLSLHEIELFLFHPQYDGADWRNYLSIVDKCDREGCSYKYLNGKDSDPENVRIAKGCRVLVEFDLKSPGIGYIPLFDDLKDVRIILGGIHIENSYLRNLSFLSNVELIYSAAQLVEHEYTTVYPIRLVGNPYMSNISLPKLRRIISSRETPIVIEGSPLLSNESPYQNVTNLFVKDLYKELYSERQKLFPTTNGSTDFVRITSRKRLDDYAFRFNILVYGMYYPPIVIAILFNLRAAVLFVFGSAKSAIAGLRWTYTAMLVVHLLIAVDSLILYHDLTPVYFTPAPLLASKIRYSNALLALCKVMFVTREVAMNIPLVAIVYIFIVFLMSILKKHLKIAILAYFFIVVGYCGFEAITLYSTVEVRARRPMNLLARNIEFIPMDNYAIIAAVGGTFSPESTMIDADFGLGVPVFEKTIYTDGLEMNLRKQLFEYISLALFGIFLVIKMVDRRDRLSKLPYDLSLTLIILQYAVLRYATLRNFLIRFIYPITCIGYKKCAERYSFDHAIAMITHHGVYVLMCVCSLLVWYTARHFHFLGKLMQREMETKEAKSKEKFTNSSVLL